MLSNKIIELLQTFTLGRIDESISSFTIAIVAAISVGTTMLTTTILLGSIGTLVYI